MMIRARAGLVRARTGLVNRGRGLAKCYGERLQGCKCAQYESGKSRRAEFGTATGPGAVAVGHRRAERTHLRVRRSDRSVGASELSASRTTETDQRSGHA